MNSQLPVPRSGETSAYNQQMLPPSPEAFVGMAPPAEKPVARQEQALPASPQPAPSLPAPTQVPVSSPTTPPVLNPLASSQDNTPAIASDDDVIEKEWVDKAKKIVNQTKDDPYQQEKEVSRLQADYLKKRYGKDVKLASD